VGFLRLLLTLAAFAGLLLGAATGQEPPGREAEIQRIRQLPADEKKRLKEALHRFNSLTPAQRDALRAKARAIGPERLGELAGRDIEKLHRKHASLQREVDEILRLLGGSERLRSLTPDERAYVRAEAIRGFHRHCRQQLLEDANLAQDFDQLPFAEKRRRFEEATVFAIRKLLDEQTPEDRARHLALPAAEQRRARAELMAEWRMRETTEFVKKFERFRLFKLLEMPPEERSAELAKRVRWMQLFGLMQRDGADKDTLRMLGQLGADERAQVAQVYEQAQDLPVADRRTRTEEKIRELYGRSSFDTERLQRPPPRLRELLRSRERRAPEPAQPQSPR
jgi:DNA gyrase/topoisomerase IV subunit A